MQYSRWTTVKTISYANADVPTQQPEPRREGVRHIEVDAERAGQRLDNFLMRVLENVPRSRIYRLVRRGEVRVNGRRASPAQRLNASDRIRLPPVRLEAQPAAPRVPSSMIELLQRAVIHEDDRLLVLDKPAGVAVHGGSGVSFGIIEALRAARPHEELELVHRLDRDTSGCLLIARKASALRTLHALLREGQFEKGYLALVQGPWDLGRKRIDVPLRTDLRVSGERTVRAHASGKEAVSEFKPVQFFGSRATLMEVAIHTGRTHQIRVHAAHAGHPVAGDEKYGDAEFNRRMREVGLSRMFLHAHSVSFEWPGGGSFSASAPLPDELRAVLDRLGEGGGGRTAAARGRGRP
jgi:23S rRNA pseudouridine955/2504/2580 synthase